MKDINDRFLEFYDYLTSQNIVSSGKDFAQNICVSASFITEIKKGRTNVGLKAIQNSVIKYGLNSEWLITGSGDKIKITGADPADEVIYLRKRIEELIEEKTILKMEIKDLIKSRGSNNDKPAYSLESEPVTTVAASPDPKYTR